MPPPTVLLVESHEDSRTIYTTVLRHHGFEVLAGARAAEALRDAGAARGGPGGDASSRRRAPNGLEAVRAAAQSILLTQHAPLLVLEHDAGGTADSPA